MLYGTLSLVLLGLDEVSNSLENPFPHMPLIALARDYTCGSARARLTARACAQVNCASDSVKTVLEQGARDDDAWERAVAAARVMTV